MKKANSAQFSKLLTRTTPLPLSPEVKLIIAVLVQAWSDADNYSGSKGAIRFFVDGRADKFAELIGINPTFLKETFMKHHSKSYEAL